MDDHSTLYGAPEAFERFNFLFGARPFRPRSQNYPIIANSDLLDDLFAIVGRYLKFGLDVIVVDQTTPEHKVMSLSCVKVLIPGTLPMTFGHQNRRVVGLDRLLEVPFRLGFMKAPLEFDDINPYPHPFP